MSNRLNDEPKKQVKMRIKAFTTTMEESYLNSIWNMLKNAIHEIQKKNNGGLSFEELYRNAYTMVLHKHGEKLYTGLREVVSEHLTNKVFVDVSSARYHNFLSTLNAAWTDHQTAMVMIRDILMYMDRVYVMQTQGVEPVYNLGLILFRDKIVRAPPIRNCLRCAMMTMIHKERNGLLIDRGALKNACQMLLIIGIDSRNVYVEDFEKYFLSTTANFYKQESQVYLALNDAAAYLRKVDIRIEEERERVLNVLCKHTEPKLMEVLERELIINHMRSILEMENSGIYQMLQNDDIEDLSCLYKLFRRVPDGCQAIADCISIYLKQQGKNLMNFEQSGTDKVKISITLIRGLLELRQRFDKILQDAFGNDVLFKMTISSSFESFINVSSRISEYLSLFIDDLLRKGSKTFSETELEQLIDRVMVLFRYIQDKDAFERYYKLHFSKRLLLGKSFNDDCEKRVILKLKSEYGCQYTNKLEGMVRDIAVSDTLTEQFRHFQADEEVNLPVDFTCRILTTGFWPTQGDESACNLPETLNYVFNTFEHFYATKHNGRQLSLQHSLGSADVNAFFVSNNTTRKFIFQVNTYQMCILLLFNTRDSWTFEEILLETEIRKKDLARALSGLCSSSKSHQKVLIKTPVEGCNMSDKFGINENFASKCVRVKISPGAPVKDSKEDASLINETQKRIDEDRKHEIEAAIVRIMKARKRMNHSQLMSEITSQLKSRFMPDPVVVKKRIENLIERDYIYRNDDDMKVYTYRA